MPHRDEEDNTEVPASFLFESNTSSKPDRGNRDQLRKGTGGFLGGGVSGRGGYEAGPSTVNTRHLREQYRGSSKTRHTRERKRAE